MWEHKGIDRPHLDVLDYKLQECQRELAELDVIVKEKTDEANIIENQLPEPMAMMSAQSYKTKFVDSLIKRLKALVIKTLSRYFEARTGFER